ncbi:MAG: hypothetical protein ACAI25_01005, partial [Planctomycetota bacterium]
MGFARVPFRAVVVAALFALAAPRVAHAQGDTAPVASAAKAGKVTEVTIGLYLSQIMALQVKENNFTCDFYVWFRWEGDDDLKPLDSFEIVNGKIDNKVIIEQKKIGNLNYANARVNATVVEYFELHRFPMDSHHLVIEIEDGKEAENTLKFKPDTDNSGIDPRVTVRGFAVTGATTKVETHVYKTNYGDTSLPLGNASKFSRFYFDVEIKRPDNSFLLKLYWTVFLSTVIGLLAFRVKPNDLDPRFGLGVGAIFACAASTYVISGYLPDTDYLTLADKLNFLAVSFIFGSILQSTIALRFHVTGREATAEKLD